MWRACQHARDHCNTASCRRVRVAGLKCRVWRLEGRTFGGVAFGVDACPAGRSTGRALMAWGGERGSAALLRPCEAVRVRDVRVRARSSRRAAVDPLRSRRADPMGMADPDRTAVRAVYAGNGRRGISAFAAWRQKGPSAHEPLNVSINPFPSLLWCVRHRAHDKSTAEQYRVESGGRGASVALLTLRIAERLFAPLSPIRLPLRSSTLASQSQSPLRSTPTAPWSCHHTRACRKSRCRHH